MIVARVTSSSGNNFSAVLGCEHCGKYANLKYGYDDGFYHSHVIPSLKCPYCSLDSRGRSLGVDDGVNGIEILQKTHTHDFDKRTPWGTPYCSSCAKAAE